VFVLIEMCNSIYAPVVADGAAAGAAAGASELAERPLSERNWLRLERRTGRWPAGASNSPEATTAAPISSGAAPLRSPRPAKAAAQSSRMTMSMVLHLMMMLL
jgi:hypothetical protein